ncbi:DNA-3-methyladenine glycosylase [Microlunatus flavus]|uniref:Putative 3-methyladenine DNA glycosylase n=1 Tax=Microlunatus flavus TaxID=1036181 RepID=A0A1H9LC85_9ACTN|nr:DNA-3-methyladenine glycosylase [Microlunatus flavus]SER08787.1 DNA-3-methyladenine glycosylase [Microlunatus flavus]
MLTPDVLAGPAPEVAPLLLGAVLRHGEVAVELTEVEAYAGRDDPASHAFRGPTPRNDVMFGPPGHLYLYFSYGMHWAANVVCGPDGTASGCLMRAGRVVDGLELARERRLGAPDRDLARGPGRLTQALGLGPEQRGADLFAGGLVRLEPHSGPPVEVASGPRVGVSRAADVPWRFWVAGSRYVSAYKRSPRAEPHPTAER